MSVPSRWTPRVMAALLAGYVLMHSPAVGVLARLTGLRASRCYFLCSGAASIQLGDALAAVCALALATAGGWRIATWIQWRRCEQCVVFGLATLALATVPAAFLGTAGWAVGWTPLRPPLGPLLTALPSAALLGWSLLTGWRPELPKGGWATSLPRLTWTLLVVALGLLSASALASVSHPPTSYDVLAYHAPLAVYFWRDGNLGAVLERQPWAWALAHPGTAELWFGLLRLAGGERVANLGQLPFALLGAVAVYAFARRLGAGRAGSSLGAAAFLLAPVVVLQAGVQLNDLMAGVLLMAGVALAAAPRVEWDVPRLWLVGLALGLAVTTKLGVLPAVVAVGLACLVGALGRARRRTFLALCCGFLPVVAPWWMRNLALFGNPIFPADIPFLGRGIAFGDFGKKDAWFVPGSWAWPLYPLIDPHSEISGFGALFLVAVVPGLVLGLARARRWPVALAVVTLACSLPAWWRLTTHEPRFLLGPVGLGFAFVAWTLRGTPRGSRAAAAALLAIGAVFSMLVTLDQALIPLARAPGDRQMFYDLIWGVDSVAAGLPRQDGMLYHTGHAPLSYAGDYPLLGPGQGRILVAVDGILSTDSIVAIMRRRRLRYAYIPSRPAEARQVEAMYPLSSFELVRVSVVVARGPGQGDRRYLYRLRER
jgi:hypothetical protein